MGDGGQRARQNRAGSGKQLEGYANKLQRDGEQQRTGKVQRNKVMDQIGRMQPKVAPSPPAILRTQCSYVPAPVQQFGKISLTAIGSSIDASARKDGHCPKRATTIHVAMLPFRPCQNENVTVVVAGAGWSGAGFGVEN